MYWLSGIFAVVVVLGVLLVNLWWRKKIAKKYKALIVELQEKRSGKITDVYVAQRERKKYSNPRDWESEVVLWSTNEGFPVDFTYSKKRGKREQQKLTLKAVIQDGRHNVYLQGLDRETEEERSIDFTSLDPTVKLPMYKIMSVNEFLKTVCGLRVMH